MTARMRQRTKLIKVALPLEAINQCGVGAGEVHSLRTSFDAPFAESTLIEVLRSAPLGFRHAQVGLYLGVFEYASVEKVSTQKAFAVRILYLLNIFRSNA